MDRQRLKEQIEDALRENDGFVRFQLWNSQSGGRTTYYLKFGNHSSEKVSTLSELSRTSLDVCKSLGGMLKTAYDGYCDFPSTLCVVEPSKVFTKLQGVIAKWGDKPLGKYDLYFVRQFGKRGRYEDKTPLFLCQNYKVNERPCNEILEWIKSNRKGKNTLKVETIERVDHEDQDHSRYYETECYGSRQVNLVLSVVTPSGRVKASREFWVCG